MANNNYSTACALANSPEHYNIWSKWRTPVDAIEWAASVSGLEKAVLTEDWINLSFKEDPERKAYKWYSLIHEYITFGKRYW